MQQCPLSKNVKESNWTSIASCIVMVLALFLDCIEYMRQPVLNNYEGRHNATTTINETTIIFQPEDTPKQAKKDINESGEKSTPKILPCDPDETLPKPLPLRH